MGAYVTTAAPPAHIESVPLAQLRPAPWNPRLIREPRFKQLCRSIQADPDFLWRRPVLATVDGTIYAGNMRFRAADHLGWESVPAIREDVPEQLAKERALRDNNAWGEWQEQELAELLAELHTAGSDLDLLGFEPDRLTELLELSGVTGEPTPDPGADLDRADELRQKWQTERGQLWLVGHHRLLCGDATNAEDVARLMVDGRSVLMATDPPYGVAYDSTWRAPYSSGEYSVGTIANDQRSDWSDVWRLWQPHVLYVWHGGLHAATVAAGIEAAGYELRGQIIWNKSVMVFGRGHYHWKHEPCWYAVRRGVDANWQGDRSQHTVWDYGNGSGAGRTGDAADDFHAAHISQKPVELFRIPIQNHTGKGDVVAEPFAGSGSQYVAAEQTGRTCYGMDIEPKYVAVTLERLSQMGLDARLADG